MEIGLSLSLTSNKGVGVFNPMLYSPVVWVDASDPASVVLAGSKISQLTDKSGNSNHFTQSTDANRPASLAAGIGGRTVANFTGGAVKMAAAGPAIGAFTTGYTWFTVFVKVGAAQAFETVLTRTPLTDEYNAVRLIKGSTLTTTLNISTATSPVVRTQRFMPSEGIVEEFGNRLNKGRLYDPGMSAGDGDTNANLVIASRNSDGFTSGRIYLGEALCFVGRLSTKAVRQIENYLAAKWGISIAPPANSINIIGHGDSITKGYLPALGVTAPWFSELVAGITPTSPGVVYSFNRGINGQGFDYVWPSAGVSTNLIDEAADEVDAARITGADNRLVIFAGTNDIVLGSKTGAQAYALSETYIQDRLAAGWVADSVTVCTMLPRDGVETARTAYNSALVAGAATYGYRLARLDLNSSIGLAGCNADTTYYLPDAIHPNNAGHAIAKSIIQTAMGL